MSHKTAIYTVDLGCTLISLKFNKKKVSKKIVIWCQLSNFSAISWWEQVNFQWNDYDICFVLDQHAELDFYSARQSFYLLFFY
jgi:hypothetical protein